MEQRRQRQPITDIQNPHKNDVLCGRGRMYQNHPGNAFFREMVKEHVKNWATCSPANKKKIPEMIVNAIQNLTPPGRF